MAQRTPYTPRKDLTNALGVKWFFHFPKDLMRPYGRAFESLDDSFLAQKIKHHNCEFLNRPDIAMSEYSQTLEENIESIEEFAEVAPQIARFLKRMRTVMPSLAILNSRNDAGGDRVEAATKVLDFLRAGDNFLDVFCVRGFEMSSALAHCIAHTQVLRHLVKNSNTVSHCFLLLPLY